MTETSERAATLDALRIEIARALGWTVTRKEGRTINYASSWGRSKNYKTVTYDSWTDPDGNPSRSGPPDWPRDDGAALRLCVEIAQPHNWWPSVRHGDRYACYKFEAIMGRVIYDEDDLFELHLVWRMAIMYEAGGDTPAEALSRLALEAMRVGG